MIYGEDIIEAYSPVQAYSVDPRNSGIISGGQGDSSIVVQGTRFLWVYNPSGDSGFTGTGWFSDVPGSPLYVANKSGDQLMQEFSEGGRTSLNDIFETWQNYVNAQADLGNDVVKDFQRRVGYDCWSNLNN